MNEHRLSCKVYYEDTDCLGMVYHANYLKYMERGRSEFVGAQGIAIEEWNRSGYHFVVYRMGITFKQAARLGERLLVISRFQLDTPYRGRFIQRVERDGETIVDADVEIVCLNDQQSLRELPPAARGW